MNISIISGATSGLGKEYFTLIADNSDELDEIWIIARREERLAELAKAYPDKKIVALPYDLTRESSYEEIERILAERKPNIKILINNAGFGKLGNLDVMPYGDQMRMIDLNNRALTVITSLALKYMVAGSYIINVCSIAAFAPNPRMSVYSSTKAYVLSFSKSLRFELKSKGINVLAVCPGPMNTEFLDVAGITGNSKTFKTLPYCDPRKVAEISLKKAKAGYGIYTPRAFFKIYRLLAKILPHGLIMKLSKT